MSLRERGELRTFTFCQNMLLLRHQESYGKEKSGTSQQDSCELGRSEEFVTRSGHIKGEGRVYYLRYLPSNKDEMLRLGGDFTQIGVYILVLVETCLCLFSCLTHWVNQLGLSFDNHQ